MENITLSVPNINCNHCVSSIQMELGDLEGVVSAYASFETKQVVVQYNPPADEAGIRSILTEINYPAEA